MEDSFLATFLLLMIESSLGRKGLIYSTAVSPGRSGIDTEAMEEAATALLLTVCSACFLKAEGCCTTR